MQTTSKTCKKLKDIDKVFDFEKIFSNYRVEKYEDISKKLLVEAEFEYNNAFMCNRENLLAEYSCCGVKEISINNDADVFWSFADSELERVKNICNGAKKQALLELEAFANKAGKGLSSWGFTLKYVFSETKTVKSIARDFEVIVTKMIDTISLTMTEFLTTEISAIIDRNTDIGKENILYLLKYNKSDIEKYTEKSEQILNNTNSDTRMIEKVMVSINKYNNIIKEAN